MKILSRDFSTREKVLLLALVLLLVVLVYYQFVEVPVRNAIDAAHAERSALEIELVAVEAKARQLRAMRAELDSLGELSDHSRMGSYNNSRAELQELNGILENADSYLITFASAERSGNQVRRNFSLQFTTGNYDAAEQIVDKLETSENRCLLKDLSFRSGWLRADGTSLRSQERGAFYVTVNATATFFETMYDGTEDIGLLDDSHS